MALASLFPPGRDTVTGFGPGACKRALLKVAFWGNRCSTHSWDKQARPVLGTGACSVPKQRFCPLGVHRTGGAGPLGAARPRGGGGRPSSGHFQAAADSPTRSREPRGPPISSGPFPTGPAGCPVGGRPRALTTPWFITRSLCHGLFADRPGGPSVLPPAPTADGSRAGACLPAAAP